MSFQPQPQHDRQARPAQGHRSDFQNFDSDSDSRDRNDGNEGGLSKIMLIGLIVLALVASLLMLFLDSDFWLKIAVIAALWAAVLGGILVSRYSSALRAERDRNRQLQRVHNSELRREKAEYQQREAQLESSYEQRMRDQRDEHLDQLRAELAVLRQQLSSMTGRDYTDEQISVHARAERVRELGGNSSSSSFSTPSSAATETPKQQPTSTASAQPTARPFGQSSRPAGAQQASQTSQSVKSQSPAAAKQQRKTATFTTGSFSAVRWDGQDTQETTQLPLVVDTTALEDEQPQHASQLTTQNNSQNNGQISEPAAAAEATAHSRHSTPLETSPSTDSFHAEPAAQPARAAQASQGGGRRRKKEEDQPADTAHGKRRADESGGLTVAELMARFKNN